MSENQTKTVAFTTQSSADYEYEMKIKNAVLQEVTNNIFIPLANIAALALQRHKEHGCGDDVLESYLATIRLMATGGIMESAILAHGVDEKTSIISEPFISDTLAAWKELNHKK